MLIFFPLFFPTCKLLVFSVIFLPSQTLASHVMSNAAIKLCTIILYFFLIVPGLVNSAGHVSKRGSTLSWASLWLSWQRIRLQCGSPGLNPWVGKIPWRQERVPTPVSGLEKSTDSIVHRITKSRTRLSDFHYIILVT